MDQTYQEKVKHVAGEIKKLPARKAQGDPANLVRSIAAGFITIGYTAEVSIERAKVVIEFYDNLFKKKDSLGGF